MTQEEAMVRITLENILYDTIWYDFSGYSQKKRLNHVLKSDLCLFVPVEYPSSDSQGLTASVRQPSLSPIIEGEI